MMLSSIARPEPEGRGPDGDRDADDPAVLLPGPAVATGRRHAPETNGVVERFNGSLKYEHLYRLVIADVIALADETEAYRELYNAIRPHEALGFATPLSQHLAEPVESHLSEPESVQDS